LRGQKEELEHRAERPAQLVATGPEEANFVVAESSIAGCLRGRRFQSGHRACSDDLALYGPVEEAAEDCERPSCLDSGATIDNSIEEFDYIASGNFGDTSMFPLHSHIMLKNSPGFFVSGSPCVFFSVTI